MVDDNATGRKRQRVLQSDDDVFLYEGGLVADERRSEITRIRVGQRVKVILSHVFLGCVHLTAVEFDDEGALAVIGDQAFCGCTALQQVTIPSSVTKLGNYAFRGCTNLTAAQLDEGLQIIGHGAFCDCTALRQVTIPSSVTKLDNGAFERCINLAQIQFHKGLQVIGDYAFRDCRALQQVTIPSTVTKFGEMALKECTNLVVVLFDEGVLNDIGDETFSDCTALQQVAIPSSVTMLGNHAFRGCINLAVVQLNEGLQIIGGYGAFCDCRALRQVTIASSVTKLAIGTFEYCTNLAEVQLNDGLQIIERSAFHDCTSLRSVTVPSSVAKLEQLAFWSCANLTEMILLGGEKLLNQGFFDRGLSSEDGVLNQLRIDEMISPNRGYTYAFCDCPLTTIKISVPRALSERMARLPQECRLSIEGRIRDMRRLELTQDDKVLACFPVVSWTAGADDASDTDDEHHGAVDVEDTNNQTAESLHQVLRMISFHELKESSILIELAMWKSRFDEDGARADCRISVPDPAKILIMEYCGFTGFLEPAIEGA